MREQKYRSSLISKLHQQLQMRLWAKILLGIVIVVVLLVGYLFYGFYKFSSGMCENEIVSEIPNPDKTLKVVIFQRSCGATTDFSTQISVLPLSKSLPDDDGNIFVADTNHGRARSAAWGGPEAKVHWETSRKLVIEHQIMARVFKAEKQIDEVVVEYIETL
jgi:hypothetical protein